MEYFPGMKLVEFKEGAKAALPIVLGFIPVGVAFGVLARGVGLSAMEASAMSLIVFAGSSQFIAVDMLGGGAAAMPIILTTFLINLRHFLMSSTISAHFAQNSLAKTAVIAAELTDESFALAMSDTKKIDGRPSYLFGMQTTSHIAWVTGTSAGAIFGSLVNSASYGLPFALPALFICLLVLQLKSRTHLVVMLIAGALSIGLKQLLPGNWNLVLAAVFASVSGMWLKEKDEEEQKPQGAGPG
jgi:4-azaleucine resistance transporter AzlC